MKLNTFPILKELKIVWRRERHRNQQVEHKCTIPYVRTLGSILEFRFVASRRQMWHCWCIQVNIYSDLSKIIPIYTCPGIVPGHCPFLILKVGWICGHPSLILLNTTSNVWAAPHNQTYSYFFSKICDYPHQVR